MAKKYWLMKTEPDVFSFDDLLKSPKQTTRWEGVRNYQVRNFMRDEMEIGDGALIYHSGVAEPVVAGVGEIASKAEPDEAALDPKSDYYDESATKAKNPWLLFAVRATQTLKTPVTRDQLRTNALTKSMKILERGCRLSITPVSKAEFDAILKMGGAKPV